MRRPPDLVALERHLGYAMKATDGGWWSSCPVSRETSDGPPFCGEPMFVARLEDGSGRYEPTCGHSVEQVRAALRAGAGSANGSEPAEPVRIVPIAEFAAVEEPGADPILGQPGEALFPEGGDVMFYGDGGASKTTLAVDLALHLGAGDDWLGITVPKAVRVLLIEAEGPRPLFRAKLRAKLAAWKGTEPAGRVHVLEAPWARFRFPDAGEIADLVGSLEVDVLIVGPLTRVGMDELGTLQQVRDFMSEVAAFRARSGRQLLVVLIHHENKGGSVSGAWEGAGDTLLHVTTHVAGRTTVHVQKARWSSEWHKQTLELDWAPGEGFVPTEEPERDLLVEVTEWLLANPYSRAVEIATKKELKDDDGITVTIPGIGVRETDVRELLEARQDIFKPRTKEAAKEVGRHPTATVWEVREGPPNPGRTSADLRPPAGATAGNFYFSDPVGEGEVVVPGPRSSLKGKPDRGGTSDHLPATADEGALAERPFEQHPSCSVCGARGERNRRGDLYCPRCSSTAGFDNNAGRRPEED